MAWGEGGGVSRPLISADTEELEALFEAHKEDMRVLEELFEELTHRKTNRARGRLTFANACRL